MVLTVFRQVISSYPFKRLAGIFIRKSENFFKDLKNFENEVEWTDAESTIPWHTRARMITGKSRWIAIGIAAVDNAEITINAENIFRIPSRCSK